MRDPGAVQRDQDVLARLERLEQLVGDETLRPAYGGGSGAGGSLDFEEPVTLEGTTVELGDSEKGAAADHQHGIFASKAALMDADDGSFAYEEGETPGESRGWFKASFGIVCLTHLEEVEA